MICSEDKTFKLKNYKNSNQSFIIEPCQSRSDLGIEIVGECVSQIEMSPCAPRVSQVIELLRKEEEGVSKQTLMLSVQASDKELDKILNIQNYEQFLRILPSKDVYQLMPKPDLLEILDSLLVLINAYLSDSKLISLN